MHQLIDPDSDPLLLTLISCIVMPAKAGIQLWVPELVIKLDPSLRWGDGRWRSIELDHAPARLAPTSVAHKVKNLHQLSSITRP